MRVSAADLGALTRLRVLRERQAAGALSEQRAKSAELHRQCQEAEQACTLYQQRYEAQRDVDWQAQLRQPLGYLELQAFQDREAEGRARVQALCNARDQMIAAHDASEQACTQRLADLAERQRQRQALASLSARQHRLDLHQAETLADLNSEDIPHHAAR